MKILLVGGGSGGPVAPLLAVAKEIKSSHHPNTEFLLVGTHNGPEMMMAQQSGIAFRGITSGKLRRYFSWQNFVAPFLVTAGFFQSWKILNEFKPDCVFGAGSFVQVPMVWAAWFKKIPVVLHQQDVYPSLANKLCQICAAKITVTFEISLVDFSSSTGIFYKKSRNDKVVLTGNPFRHDLLEGSKGRAEKEFELNGNLPVLLVLGGGTGAKFLNQLIDQTLPELIKSFEVIHSTGKGKQISGKIENYHPYEFISNMADAYAAADIVLSRAGMSTITELSNLKKVSIIVPMPDTHQVWNAAYLRRSGAALSVEQKHMTPQGLIAVLRKLLFEHELQQGLKHNIFSVMPHEAEQKIAAIITNLAIKN